MVVRLRLRPGRRVSRKPGKNRHVALAFAALLWPPVFMAYVLGLWRLAADLGLAGGFGISSGIFSHWQVWIALGVAGNMTAILLNRYGHHGQFRLPQSWVSWITNFGHRQR